MILQLGGVQVAMMAAPPPEEEAVAGKLLLVPKAQLVLLVLTEPGDEEHQLRKLPLITLPRVSVTVALIFEVEPLAIETELPPKFAGASVIDWTRQVLKLNGVLDTPSTVTKIGLVPGTFALAVASPGNNPLTGFATVAAVKVTTLLLTACQLNGPTVDVISNPGGGPPSRL